jgi:hypothetical protein
VIQKPYVEGCVVDHPRISIIKEEEAENLTLFLMVLCLPQNGGCVFEIPIENILKGELSNDDTLHWTLLVI